MADFLKSLALSFNAPGLSPRAITLFNQARSVIKFRWGKKATSVAGACLAIALREANRPDSLCDIASILSVPPASVTREFSTITSTLGLSLTLVNPSVHIAPLQAHLSSVIAGQEQDARLPSPLIKVLRALSIRSVANTATSLCHLLPRLSTDHDVLRLPVAPTACAIFMLALEAENRAVLNSLGDLAQCLGTRCHAAGIVIMSRYKIVQDEIALWIESLPWLDKYESKNGRAKVPKRLVVARGIKDVIRFQEQVWQQRAKPTLHLELVDDTKEDGDQEDLTKSIVVQPIKRSKANQPMNQATKFLLDPVGTSITSVLKYSPNLATYILINPSNRRLPSRLQLLAMDRGGANEDQIPDEELFSEGEFEKLLRNKDEISTLRQLLGWPEGEDHDNEEEKEIGAKRKRKRADEPILETEDMIIDGLALHIRKTPRLNMDALAEFLANDQTFVIDGEGTSNSVGDDGMQMMGLDEAFKEDDYDFIVEENDSDTENHEGTQFVNDATLSPRRRRLSTSTMREASGSRIVDADEEVILDNWRPPTPDQMVAFSDSRYEEEYD